MLKLFFRTGLTLLYYIGDGCFETPIPISGPPKIPGSCTNSSLQNAFWQIRNLVVLGGARPVETEGRVGVELADDAVAGGAKGDGQDGGNGEQLDGDLLEGADALGDGVRWDAALVRVLADCRTCHIPECSSFCDAVSIGPAGPRWRYTYGNGSPHLRRSLEAEAPGGLGAEGGRGALPEHVESTGGLHCVCGG